MEIFPSAWSCSRGTSLLPIYAGHCSAVFKFTLYQWRADKGWVLTPALFIATTILYQSVNWRQWHRLTWTQNGSTHGHVFATFKRWLLTNRTIKGVKNCDSVSLFCVPFLSMWLVILLRFNSPWKFTDTVSLARCFSSVHKCTGGCKVGCSLGERVYILSV